MMRAALAVALVATTSSVATAGAYVGLGIGTNAASDASDRLVEDGRSARLLVGYQFRPMKYGSISLEGSIGGYGLGLKDRTSIVELDAYQYAAAGRFNLPLSNNFEAFGRLGLQHTSAGGASPLYDVSGNGFLVGAGMAYLFHIGIGSGAAVSVDYQINRAEISGERFQPAALTERQWTLGVTLGF